MKRKAEHQLERGDFLGVFNLPISSSKYLRTMTKKPLNKPLKVEPKIPWPQYP